MLKSSDYWIETYTGKQFHLLNPTPDEIDIVDIAQALSLLCRYTGMCSRFYSVADHACRVAEIVPEELKFAALMHDCSEAYLSDISRPLKKLLPQYQDIENIVQGVIQEKYGIGELSVYDLDLIKKADNILLSTEARDLLPNVDGWYLQEKPLTGTIEPLTSQGAYISFLTVFNKHCPKEFRVDLTTTI